MLKRILFSLFAVALCIIAATAQQASAGTSAQVAVRPNVFQSSKGYRLTYPSGWLIADAKDRASLREASSQYHLNLDPSAADVLIHAPSSVKS